MSTISSASATITAATANGYVTVADATPFVVDAFVWLNKTGQPNLYCQITEITGNNIGVQAQPAPGSGPSYGRTDVSLYNAGTIFQDIQDVYSFEPSSGGSSVAADVSVTPSGNLTSTNVQAALVELQGDVDGRVTANAPVVGATKTKITFDAKGLVTAGADATTADVADSLDKRYVTDAQLVVIGNTSGTNTGDQTSVSGNAGTATSLQTARTINGVSFDGTANIITPTISNTNGTGASDICVTMGSSVSDGSVNSSARLLSIRTGVGGTENEKLYVDKNGDIRASALGNGLFRGSSASSGKISVDDSLGINARYGTMGSTTDGSNITFSETATFGTILKLGSSGLVTWGGTDSSGTPGAATINKPAGKSSIAAGAASVVITNSLVVPGSVVQITPHDRDATCKELIAVPTTGSFTVSGSAAATSTLTFSWQVIRLG